MSHFGTNASGVKATPAEWLKVGSQIGTLVNKWAERNDLVVYVGGEMSAPVSALFDPATAEIEVNAKDAFGIADPEIVGDLNDRSMMYEFPKATGAILHEACHARFTQWSLVKSNADLKPRENEALHLLEEGRIEGLGILTFPENAEFLRASAMEIVIGDLTDEKLAGMSGTRAFAQIAGLVGGRIDAGVLDYADVKPVLDLAIGGLGQDLYDQLRMLWRKAQAHTKHSNADDLYPLAIEWERLVSEKAKEKGEETEKGEGSGGEGCIPIPSEILEAIQEALEKSADESSWTATINLGDQEGEEKREQEVKERQDEGKRRQQNKEAESKVFTKASGEIAFGHSGSKLVETRKPTSAERVASVKVGQMLDKAKYRERDVAIVRSVLPQGRLKSRAMVQGEALKSKGILTPVEAWQHKTRKHTDEPTLSIGVMVDVSGSMGGAMNPMATTAWVLAEAGRRIQARTAMVYYGEGVFPTLRVGQRLDEVNVYSAPDGTEKFNEAFMALDGHMNLLDSRGAKLLVIVSDGHYSGTQPAKAKEWIRECDKRGVAVLWLTFDKNTSTPDTYLAGTSGRAVSLAGSTPEQSAILIGKTCADIISTIGRRNA
jgi:hypothetical protein